MWGGGRENFLTLKGFTGTIAIGVKGSWNTAWALILFARVSKHLHGDILGEPDWSQILGGSLEPLDCCKGHPCGDRDTLISTPGGEREREGEAGDKARHRDDAAPDFRTSASDPDVSLYYVWPFGSGNSK